MCGGIKKGLPPIEQHPLQIRQRLSKKHRVKKALPPSSRRTRFVSDALLVKELNRASQQQQLRRMESRFSSHYRKMFLPQTHPDMRMHPDTPIQLSILLQRYEEKLVL